MTRTSKALKRLGVAGLAAVTIGAGMPALLATGAQAAAGPTANLAITPTSQQGAAGTCLVYTVTATDVSGGNTTDTPTVTVSLTENPVSNTQQVGFCDPVTFAKTGPNTALDNTSPLAATSTTQTFQTTRTSSTAPASVKFGVYGTTAGGADIRAFQDTNGNNKLDSGEIASAVASAVFTAGGQNSVTSLTDATASPGTVTAGGNQVFTLLAKNSAGDPVSGVTVTYFIKPGGANAPTTTQYTDCTGQTGNDGKITCSVAVAKAGTDTFEFFVNQSSPSTAQTAGPDATEPKVDITRTTFAAPNTNTAESRNITVKPTNTSTPAGSSRDFVATVVDAAGVAVKGVYVCANITNGPGRLTSNNQRSDCDLTDGLGQVTFTASTFTSETGTQSLSFTIYGTSECGNAKDDPTAGDPKGNCTAVAENIITAASSPTATPTASTSPSSSTAPAGRSNLTLTVNTPDIPAGANATLTGTGSANQQYQLQCYTRPSTTYFTARSGAFNAAGDPVTFTLSLGRNTRCFLQYATNSASGASPSGVVNVHTVLSLSTVRTGVRTYIFQGRNLPRIAGQLITLYRVDRAGNEIRTSNLVTDNSGIYRVTRKFTGTGTFQFKVRTSQTLNNAAGFSNTITVNVH